MFPAVSLHSKSLPLVVVSWRLPVQTLYMERRFLFLDRFTEVEVFYSLCLGSLSGYSAGKCKVCVCRSWSYRGGLQARVTFWGDEIIVCGAGLWLWAVLLAEWMAPTRNHMGKPLPYFRALLQFEQMGFYLQNGSPARNEDFTRELVKLVDHLLHVFVLVSAFSVNQAVKPIYSLCQQGPPLWESWHMGGNILELCVCSLEIQIMFFL